MEKILSKWKNSKAGAERYGALALAGTVTLWLLFYFVLHRPLVDAAAEYRQQAGQAAAEVTSLVNFRNEHLQLQEYAQELGRRELRARHALPEDMAQGEFLVALERLAIRSQLRILSVSPGKVISQGESICLPLRLEVVGDYFSLLKFLQGLQQGERLVIVKNIAVKSDKDKKSPLAAELGINIFAVSDE